MVSHTEVDRLERHAMSIDYLPAQPPWSDLQSCALGDLAPMSEIINAIAIRYNFVAGVDVSLPVGVAPGGLYLEDGADPFSDQQSIYTLLSKTWPSAGSSYTPNDLPGYKWHCEQVRDYDYDGRSWVSSIPSSPTVPSISNDDPASWYAYVIALRDFIDLLNAVDY